MIKSRLYCAEPGARQRSLHWGRGGEIPGIFSLLLLSGAIYRSPEFFSWEEHTQRSDVALCPRARASSWSLKSVAQRFKKSVAIFFGAQGRVSPKKKSPMHEGTSLKMLAREREKISQGKNSSSGTKSYVHANIYIIFLV